MNKNKLKYIHGALTIAQSRAEGRELEIMKSAAKMVKSVEETIERLKVCENCDHSGKPYYDRYGAPHCDKGANTCIRWNDTEGLPDLWDERND